MYPDYRRTAEHRQEKALKGCLVLATCLIAIVVAGAYLFAAYVATHFIEKFW